MSNEVTVVIGFDINGNNQLEEAVDCLKQTAEYQEICDDLKAVKDFLEEHLVENDAIVGDIRVTVIEQYDSDLGKDIEVVLVEATD